MLLLLAATSAAGQAEPDHRVKALFIYNFSTDPVVRWPGSAFPTPESPFVIGLLSPGDPLDDDLREFCKGKKAQGRPIRVLRSDDPAELGACHLIFVAPKGRPKAEQVVELAKTRPVLTMSETEGFCATGGIVNLYLNENRKIRYEANPDAAAKAGLSISANILKDARIVTEKKP